jgi:uncharacterized membrane protein
MVIVGLVVLVRFMFVGGSYPTRGHGRSPGLDVLEERYAKGEINPDEYLQ